MKSDMNKLRPQIYIYIYIFNRNLVAAKNFCDGGNY